MLNLFGERFKMRYIIFGSENSLDLDILVWIPNHLTKLPSHEYIKAAKIVDNIVNSEKSVNSSFGHWDINTNDTNNSKLLWCQKGSLGETNNSIIYTYKNHEQIYPLEFKKLLKRNIPLKIMTSIRTILGKLSRTQINRPNLDNIIYKYINNPYFNNKYLLDIFGGKSNNNKVRNNMVRNINNTTSIDDISVIIDLLEDQNIFRRLIKYTMKNRKLGMSLYILKLDFTLYQFPRNTADRLKTIAFQLGQSIGLIEGIELFDKHDIALKYPLLKDFLDRTNTYDMTKLNKMMLLYINRIKEYGLDMNCTELDF